METVNPIPRSSPGPIGPLDPSELSALQPQWYVLLNGQYAVCGMRIPVATQDAASKYFKGSVTEKITEVFVDLCDEERYLI